MRERQPGIYHQYIGQYRPPEPPQGAGWHCLHAVGLGACGACCCCLPRKRRSRLAWADLAGCDGCPLQAARAARRGPSWLRVSCGSRRSWPCGSGRPRSSGSGTRLRRRGEEESEEGAKEGGKEPAAAGGQAAADGRRQQQEAPAPAAASVQHAAAAASVAQAGPPGDEEEEAAADDPGEGPSHVIIPKEEQQENDAAFLDIMQQRFLAGRDAGVGLCGYRRRWGGRLAALGAAAGGCCWLGLCDGWLVSLHALCTCRAMLRAILPAVLPPLARRCRAGRGLGGAGGAGC